MSGFTPGPWKACTRALGGGPLEPGAVVMRAFPGNVLPDDLDMSTLCVAEGLTAANAHLIAAATELYEQLDTLERLFRQVLKKWDGPRILTGAWDACDTARTILAKATP